jgi:predicted amidohydrolase YtcJ
LQPLRSLVSRGVRVAGSSDAPVGPLDPLVGIAAAVGRETRRGVRLGPAEALSLDGAFDLYTGAAAYVTCFEGAAGRIAVGRQADLLVLSADVTRLPAARLDTARVRFVVQGERCTTVDPAALDEDSGHTAGRDRPSRAGSLSA